MINLLPNETQKQLRAARSNVKLINYILFSILAVIFLTIACFVTYLYLNNIDTTFKEANEVANQPTGQYALIKNQIDNTNTTITSSKNALNQQISYSNIITSIGSSLPEGVILDALSLNNESSFNNPIILRFKSTSADKKTAIEESLKKLPIFSTFTISTTENSNDQSYPIIFSANVTMNKVINQ